MVKIMLILLCDVVVIFFFILFKDLDFFKSLYDFVINVVGGFDVVGGVWVMVFGVVVNVVEVVDINGFVEVDVMSDGSGMDVELVDVLGRYFFGGVGFDGVNLIGDGEFVLMF